MAAAAAPADQVNTDPRARRSVDTPAPPPPPPPPPIDLKVPDNSVGLSSQWLQPMNEDTKLGRVTGEPHPSVHPGSCPGLFKLSTNGAVKHQPLPDTGHYKERVTSSAVLQNNSVNNSSRYSVNARRAIHRDPWRERDKEPSVDNSSRYSVDARRVPYDRWTDSGSRENNHGRRRESKWNTRWGPDDEESKKGLDQWTKYGKDNDGCHGAPQMINHGKDMSYVKEDRYRENSSCSWRSNSFLTRGRGEATHNLSLTPNKPAPFFAYGRGRGENGPPIFLAGRERVASGTSTVNTGVSRSYSLGAVSDKSDAVHGDPSLRYSRQNMLDIYRMSDLNKQKVSLEGCVDIPSLIISESCVPLALSAPTSEELATFEELGILKGIDQEVIKDCSVGKNAIDSAAAKQNKLGMQGYSSGGPSGMPLSGMEGASDLNYLLAQRLALERQRSLPSWAGIDTSSSGLIPLDSLLSSEVAKDPQMLQMLEQQYLLSQLQLQTQERVPNQVSLLDNIILRQQQEQQQQQLLILKLQNLRQQILSTHQSHHYGHMDAATPTGNAPVDHLELEKPTKAHEINQQMMELNLLDQPNLNLQQNLNLQPRDVGSTVASTPSPQPLINLMLDHTSQSKESSSTPPRKVGSTQHSFVLGDAALEKVAHDVLVPEKNLEGLHVIQTKEARGTTLPELVKTIRDTEGLEVRKSVEKKSGEKEKPKAQAVPDLSKVTTKIVPIAQQEEEVKDEIERITCEAAVVIPTSISSTPWTDVVSSESRSAEDTARGSGGTSSAMGNSEDISTVGDDLVEAKDTEEDRKEAARLRRASVRAALIKARQHFEKFEKLEEANLIAPAPTANRKVVDFDPHSGSNKREIMSAMYRSKQLEKAFEGGDHHGNVSVEQILKRPPHPNEGLVVGLTDHPRSRGAKYRRRDESIKKDLIRKNKGLQSGVLDAPAILAALTGIDLSSKGHPKKSDVSALLTAIDNADVNRTTALTQTPDREPVIAEIKAMSAVAKAKSDALPGSRMDTCP